MTARGSPIRYNVHPLIFRPLGMFTVELLRDAIGLARRWGYEVRFDWLGGSGGGLCHVKGKAILFLDLADRPIEQLEMVISTLSRDPRWHNDFVPRELRSTLSSRQ